jgi:hypothetical protein
MRTRLWSNWQRSPRRKQWRGWRCKLRLHGTCPSPGRATPTRQAFSLITVAILEAPSFLQVRGTSQCTRLCIHETETQLTARLQRLRGRDFSFVAFDDSWILKGKDVQTTD